jgi:hypothetical protein
MILLKKNKYKIFILFLFFSQLTTAYSVVKSNNFITKTINSQNIKDLNLLVNDPDPDVNYLEVTHLLVNDTNYFN